MPSPYVYVQIFHLLRIPLKHGGKALFSMSDLADKRYEAVRYMFQLCYRVIQHSQFDYRKNQVRTCTIRTFFVCLRESSTIFCQPLQLVANKSPNCTFA